MRDAGRAACEFVLGTHRLCWAWRRGRWRSLFINAHLLMTAARGRVRGNFGEGLRLRPTPLQVARCPVDLDSGGYLEVHAHGRWRWTAREHVALCRRVADELGRLRMCAVQDWMCTPGALARTGLAPVEHQKRTLRSFLELSTLAPDLPWVIVLQGAAPADYLRHADTFERAGVELAKQRRVMIGSIAARDDDDGIPPATIAAALRRSPLAHTRNGRLVLRWGEGRSLANGPAWAAEWGRRQQKIAASVSGPRPPARPRF